jgi:purine-binding chemotaxis protein CheW
MTATDTPAVSLHDSHQVPHTATAVDAVRQFLTFELAQTEYGLDILKVREIRAWEPVTPLPNTPTYVKGVINLRGSVVPIIDLRERLGLEPRPYGARTVVIVVNLHPDLNPGLHPGQAPGEREKVMGMVVDAVCDEHTLNESLISAPPDLGGPIGGAFVAGLVEVQGRLIVLLDSDRLLDLALGDLPTESGG